MADNKSKGSGFSFFEDLGKALDGIVKDPDVQKIASSVEKGLTEAVDFVEKEVVKPVGEAGFKAGQAFRKELILKDKEEKVKGFQNKIKSLDDKVSSIDKEQASYTELKSTANDPQLKFIDKKIAKLDVKKSMILKEKAGLVEDYKKISAELEALKAPVVEKHEATAVGTKPLETSPDHPEGFGDAGVKPTEPPTTHDSH